MISKRWHQLSSETFTWQVQGAVLIAEQAGVPKEIFIFEHLDDVSGSSFREGVSRLCSEKLEGTCFKIVGSSAFVAPLQASQVELSKVITREGPFEIFYSSVERKIRASRLGTAVAGSAGLSNSKKEKIKIIVVDDSKTIRNLLEKIFTSDPDLEVIASCEDPLHVEEAILKYKPDVMTLDIHMPGMDGITLLRELMPRYKIPTIMISSISKEEGPQVLEALEAGAIDYIQKPSFQNFSECADTIIQSIKVAAAAKLQRKAEKRVRAKSINVDQSKIVLIGSSTGGTEAIRAIFDQLPAEIPPILIVQHIPAVFSAAFADRLNAICPFVVKEAQHGDLVVKNQVLVAPGGKQMGLVRSSQGFSVAITDDLPVNRHRPSVDFLFDSATQYASADWVAVILTGMGADGARGLAKLRKSGVRTIAQDEESSVVYGMPREAVKHGGVEFVLPLDQVAEKIISLSENKKMLKAAI